MKAQPISSDLTRVDMSPEAIDRRLRDLAQIYKLGMSLRGAKWLGQVNAAPTQNRERLSRKEE